MNTVPDTISRNVHVKINWKVLVGYLIQVNRGKVFTPSTANIWKFTHFSVLLIHYLDSMTFIKVLRKCDLLIKQRSHITIRKPLFIRVRNLGFHHKKCKVNKVQGNKRTIDREDVITFQYWSRKYQQTYHEKTTSLDGLYKVK